jgi:hypothetical protein
MQHFTTFCFACDKEISFMKKKNLGIKRSLLVSVAVWLALIVGAPPALADNAVKLRILLLTTGDITADPGFAYIKPVLDEMGVPYDVVDVSTQDLTPAMLASSSIGTACKAVDAGCVGNYNGIIATDSDLVPAFTPAEWDTLHDYQKGFGVRQAVLSGWPGTYWDPNPPYGIHLDYGLVYSSSGNNYESAWTVPAAYSKEIFEYVNQTTPLQVTDFAFAANPRNDGTAMRDGTVANAIPLVKTQNGEALVSIVQYTMPNQATPVREVMISTITNASFLIHSKVLAYEFINWVTQGVFVGKRYVHMTAHVDDLFLANTIWEPALKSDDPNKTYRLNSTDISNAVSQQAAFRTAHPLAGNFKLDFAFNGAGAVVDPTAATLTANMSEDLVAAVVANKADFRFINHTFTHADMDKPPVPADAPCVYNTFTTIAAAKAEITKNRTVWGLLGLPEKSQNNRVLVTGNHSGLKDRRCTDDQADDVHFDQDGANPIFLEAASDAGVDYLASDSSQRAQNIEQYISQYNDGSANMDRLMLPRWPTNVFYNVTNPTELTSEYNYIFYQRFIDAGQDPCQVPGAICTPRDYGQILLAEADTAFRHMLTFNKWPHFFHQTNVAKYDGSGSTLQFDWLKAVFTEYGRLFKLPVRNYPFYWIGDNTEEGLKAKSANILAVWNRGTNQVTLSANKPVPLLFVTGITGGELYGGQFIRRINITTTPQAYAVNRGLTQ